MDKGEVGWGWPCRASVLHFFISKDEEGPIPACAPGRRPTLCKRPRPNPPKCDACLQWLREHDSEYQDMDRVYLEVERVMDVRIDFIPVPGCAGQTGVRLAIPS